VEARDDELPSVGGGLRAAGEWFGVEPHDDDDDVGSHATGWWGRAAAG